MAWDDVRLLRTKVLWSFVALENGDSLGTEDTAKGDPGPLIHHDALTVSDTLLLQSTNYRLNKSY